MMTDWRDDPALAYLRDDAPYRRCGKCGRKTWSGDGGSCGMPQPDGSVCDGTFGPSWRPDSLEAALDAIVWLPSEHDLLTNAVARAMWEYAHTALASAPGTGAPLVFPDGTA